MYNMFIHVGYYIGILTLAVFVEHIAWQKQEDYAGDVQPTGGWASRIMETDISRTLWKSTCHARWQVLCDVWIVDSHTYHLIVHIAWF